jgi:N-alpha-acetyl-L-2,4-diaminobutyrate deacetylase
LIAGQQLQTGKMLAVPFGNVRALRRRRPHISSTAERPYAQNDGHNMNLTWPGKPDGNDTERVSHAIYNALGDQATHCIDIHCWSRFTAPAALPTKEKPQSLELARISALPFVNPRSWQSGGKALGLVGAQFDETGRTSLTLELSGQYVIYEKEVRRGLRCVLNVARFLKVLPGEPEGLDERAVWLDKASVVDVKAPHGGLFAEAELATCDWVQEGQLLGWLLSDSDLSATPILAPVSGRLYEYGCSRADCDVALPAQHPYASKGDRLAKVAAPRDG